MRSLLIRLVWHLLIKNESDNIDILVLTRYSKSAQARGGACAWHTIMCEYLFEEVLETRY